MSRKQPASTMLSPLGLQYHTIRSLQKWWIKHDNRHYHEIETSDFFCGAGGSTTGLEAAGFISGLGVNHWHLAANTFQLNHPDADVDCANMLGIDPRRYKRTPFAWFSPECDFHSGARGKIEERPATLFEPEIVSEKAQRSRATMNEVYNFMAYHKYDYVVVENVPRLRKWPPFFSWLNKIADLGYDYKILWLNSQFFGVPQSRNRFYAVFWRKGLKAPDLNFCPPAQCQKCDCEVAAQQVFKRQHDHWGEYNRQYVYRCPKCSERVYPYHTPALIAIDWTLPGTRIGDRDEPLKDSTQKRIIAGFQKLAGRSVILDTCYSNAEHNGKVRSSDDALPTQTSRQSHALAYQPMYVYQKGDIIGQPVDSALHTITGADSHGLVLPPDGIENPWVLTHRQSWQAHDVSKALSTITAGGNNHALVYSYYNNAALNDVETPLATVMPQNKHALVTYEYPKTIPNIDDCYFRMLQPHELLIGQSFPADYQMMGNKGEQVELIGNAVPCRQAEAIGNRILDAMMSYN